MIVERISQFLRDPSGESFHDLALDAFAFQYERIAAIRRLCQSRGVKRRGPGSWREVPAVAASAFKSVPLRVAPGREVFRSSGTTLGQRRSVHEHPFPELYRLTIDVSFPDFCLRAPGRLPILSLIPPRREVPDSSLSFMVEHVLKSFGARESETALGPGGVDVAKVVAWLRSRCREGRPVLLLTTALALLQCLEGLEQRRQRFSLPEGSVVFETGGFKARGVEIAREELLRRVEEDLGLGTLQVVREYGMTELTSQAYTRALLGGDPDLFVTPHWMKVRVLDPETLEEAPPGETGIVAIFDLANVGSALHLLTEDLGVAEGEGFRLLGRASGAELRGCSLTAQELASQGMEVAGSTRGVADGDG